MHMTTDTSNSAPRNQLVQIVARTMSSREISDLVEARHNDVVTTIERLFDKGLLRSSRKTRRESTGGRPLDVYDLIERDTHLVVAGYSDEHRARVVDRWQDLEEGQLSAHQLPNFASPAEAARAWAEQFEQRQAAEEALLIAAPKAEFVDRYVDATGSMGFRQVAKLLKAKEHQLKQMLISKGVMYYLGGTLTPCSQHLDAGRFEIKTGTSERNSHSYAQARFTAKGVQWIAGLWAKYQMEIEA